jgi:hypothetical protein
MANRTHYEIPLFDVGVAGAGFRVENDGNELQRAAIDQYKDSDIKYVADLVAVVHGTMAPPAGKCEEGIVATSSGHSGVLLVIDFQFLSNPGKHRFKRVQLTVVFGREDDPIGSENEPIVKQIAPAGTFGMDEATQTQVDTASVNGSLEAGWSPVTLGIGGGFERTTTSSTKSHAILNGMTWIENRNKGPKNAALWDLRENRTLKNGVPAYLRAAILLELPEKTRFRAEVTMTADVDTFHKNVKRKVGAKTGLHPVYFDPSEAARLDLGPSPAPIVKTNLSGYNLDSIGFAKVCRLPGVKPKAEFVIDE